MVYFVVIHFTMSWPQSVLGANLLVKPEEGAPAGVPKPTKEVLAGKKYVGLYFSAHWCGKFFGVSVRCIQGLAARPRERCVCATVTSSLRFSCCCSQDLAASLLPCLLSATKILRTRTKSRLCLSPTIMTSMASMSTTRTCHGESCGRPTAAMHRCVTSTSSLKCTLHALPAASYAGRLFHLRRTSAKLFLRSLGPRVRNNQSQRRNSIFAAPWGVRLHGFTRKGAATRLRAPVPSL